MPHLTLIVVTFKKKIQNTNLTRSRVKSTTLSTSDEFSYSFNTFNEKLTDSSRQQSIL